MGSWVQTIESSSSNMQNFVMVSCVLFIYALIVVNADADAHRHHHHNHGNRRYQSSSYYSYPSNYNSYAYSYPSSSYGYNNNRGGNILGKLVALKKAARSGRSCRGYSGRMM